MKITDRLKVEHGVFLQQLCYLEALLDGGAPDAALQVAAATIAVAEEHHSRIEEQLLHPTLARRFGPDFPPLLQVTQDHLRLAKLVEAIRAGTVDRNLVRAYIMALRTHLENELHGFLPLAEKAIPPGQLTAMCDWDAEHIQETEGRP